MAPPSIEFVRKQSGSHSSLLDEAAATQGKTARRLVLLVLLVVGLSWWSWSAVNESLQRHVQSQLETQVESTRAAVDLWTERLLTELDTAARDPRVVDALAHAATSPVLDERVTQAQGSVSADWA